MDLKNTEMLRAKLEFFVPKKVNDITFYSGHCDNFDIDKLITKLQEYYKELEPYLIDSY